MDRKPKLELGSPPSSSSRNDRLIRNNMTTQEIVSKLRTMREDFDKLEEVLLSKEERMNHEIGQLQEKLSMETLAKLNAEVMYEKGKKIQEACEREIAEMRKNNDALESQVLELKDKSVEVNELRKKNGELETQVCNLRKLREILGDENTELRSRVRDLEEEKITLVAFESKNGELEKEVKKNLTTIDELRKVNRKLEDEKCKYENKVESQCKLFEKLQGRVAKYDAKKGLMSVDVSGGENSEKKLLPNEGDVHDSVKVPLQRNEDIRHYLGATAGTPWLLAKGSKDVPVSSSARGRLELQKVVEIIDLEDEDEDDNNDNDNECTSRRLHGKKALSGITRKNEHPSSSVEVQQKNSFSEQSFIMKKRKRMG